MPILIILVIIINKQLGVALVLLIINSKLLCSFLHVYQTFVSNNVFIVKKNLLTKKLTPEVKMALQMWGKRKGIRESANWRRPTAKYQTKQR